MLLDKCCKGGTCLPGELQALYEPLVEYIGLVIESAKVDLEKPLHEDQVVYIYHIIVRLHEIVVEKCQKNGLVINNADTLMEYMEYLARQVSSNRATTCLYEIMGLINEYFKEQQPPCYSDMRDIEMPRWWVFYSLLGEQMKLVDHKRD